jgi:hypothetical protein
MQIVVPKTSAEIIDVKTPAFYYTLGLYTAITDSFYLTVSPSSQFVSLVPRQEEKRFADHVIETLKWGNLITQEEFDGHFNKALKCLAEQYAAAMTMNNGYIDPKEGQQENPDVAPENAANETAAETATEQEGAGALTE